MDQFRVALVQLKIGSEKEANVSQALQFIQEAAKSEPDLIILPENFSFLGTSAEILKHAETYNGPTLSRIGDAAKKYGVHILAGTLKLRSEDSTKVGNTACLIGPDGSLKAAYQKVHLFDANVGGRTYAASEVEQPGDDLVLATVNGVKIGIGVCYDLRFPEMFRILTLRGAKIICLPSMFTLHTGKDHWEPLIRARAIENQVYIAAAAVFGQYPPRQDWAYGRSMVVDPWGIIIAQAQDVSGVIATEVDLDRIDEVRRKMPCLKHRRPDVYKWPELIEATP